MLVAIPFPHQAIFLGAAGSVISAVGVHLVRRLKRPALAPGAAEAVTIT